MGLLCMEKKLWKDMIVTYKLMPGVERNYSTFIKKKKQPKKPRPSNAGDLAGQKVW